tara:strand:+ start:6382 stop:6510 length:129 start_codon:yes stop_codon:yes gene_type:complete
LKQKSVLELKLMIFPPEKQVSPINEEQIKRMINRNTFTLPGF